MADGEELMHATQLSRSIWNAMADLARRSQSPREVYYSEVTKTDIANGLIWAKDFGDVAIPLVAFVQTFAYYDTVPTGVSGLAVTTRVDKREDKSGANENFHTKVSFPKKGDVVVILDPWGAKRFPVCLGLLRANRGAWAEN